MTEHQPRSRQERFREARTWLDVSIVGIQFPVSIALGFFFGRWLDRHLGTGPWLTGVFSLFGIAAGFMNLFRITEKAARDEAEQAKRALREEDGDGP